ncbi:PEGA domain-containing protein [Methanoregula sp.]|uniref:PEGA domain-containing protein n=1 Tax=Methanoregula sp. TaxID=2052170 RepID=UPI003565466B
MLSAVVSHPAAAINGTCSISISSIPNGGSISIDGSEYGPTPRENISISCGLHTIAVSQKGFDDFLIASDFQFGEHRDIIADLKGKSDRAEIIIRTKPVPAELYVDGHYEGKTPVTVYNLLPGPHALLLTAEGYEPYKDVVTASIGMSPEYTEYLVPLAGTGFLSVTSFPEGATVIVDGNTTGITPTNLRRVASGNHTVTICKAGYWNFTGMVTVSGGEARMARADLAAIPTSGILYLDSAPVGAEIYLNNTFKGVTPLTLGELSPGDYLLEFRQPSGSSASGTFRFAAGGSYDLFAMMENQTTGAITLREWQYQNDSYMKRQQGWVMINATPVIERTFTWYGTGHGATIILDIPQDLYDYYKSQPHPKGDSRDTFSRYAISERDRLYLKALLEKLRGASDLRTYDDRTDYRNVVAFVQSIRYEEDVDPVTNQETDYWKYPVETLAEGSGDCEDTAILTAALLKEMGYDVAIVLFDDHAAVAVTCDNCNGYYYPLNNKRYYYLETTGAGFSLGTMDKKHQTSAAAVVPLS